MRVQEGGTEALVAAAGPHGAMAGTTRDADALTRLPGPEVARAHALRGLPVRLLRGEGRFPLFHFHLFPPPCCATLLLQLKLLGQAPGLRGCCCSFTFMTVLVHCQS